MTFKAAITLIFGLVFQFAQVMPAALVASPCATLETSCACCAGLESCPCAKNGDSEQKPVPLVPDSGSVLKLPTATAGDPRVSIESLAVSYSSPTLAACPEAGLSNGYPGVSLSVAYCSFAI